MPSLNSKVAIVTGATARTLAEKGATVVLACRDGSKGRATESAIAAYLQANQSTGRVFFKQIDLSLLHSVQDFTTDIQQDFSTVDLLIHNSGIAAPTDVLTPDRYETMFQVNYLAPFLTTALLYPALRASPSARIVVVSSLAHRSGVYQLPDTREENRLFPAAIRALQARNLDVDTGARRAVAYQRRLQPHVCGCASWDDVQSDGQQNHRKPHTTRSTGTA